MSKQKGCLHDNGATFIPRPDEKLHRVYTKPCLLGCESYSAVNLMKLQWIWNEQSYPVYMTPEWIFVPGWKSRSGKRTGVNSRWHDILCWYHVNEYRAIRGNRSELAPGWKSPRYHVNTPKVYKGIEIKTIVLENDPTNLRLIVACYIRKYKPAINSWEECSEFVDLLF